MDSTAIKGLAVGVAISILSGCANLHQKSIEYGLDGVVKNGTVETRIGELTFENGYPSGESVEKLYDAMDYHRATQAYLWSLPIVGMRMWQKAHEESFGVDDGDIVVYTTTKQKLGILTANATTPYTLGFVELGKKGPIVVNVPPGPSGGLINDFWQRPVIDLGLCGPDKGKGGKYLILGPGQSKPDNVDADYVYESGTMNILFGIRILTPDPDQSKAMLDAFKAYPVSDPSNVSSISQAKGDYVGHQPRGLDYWKELHVYCRESPSLNAIVL